MEAIAKVLADSDYDIVTLQELWVFADYEHVREAVSKRLPYSKFFYRYVRKHNCAHLTLDLP